MLKKRFLILGLVTSGCSTYSTDFDCPKGKGLNCASLHTVNQKVNQGEIVVEEDPAQTVSAPSLKPGEVTYFYPHREKKTQEH